jgi:hypothetical protein
MARVIVELTQGGDHQALDLVGALEDLRDLEVASLSP